uniref:Uncharacterized protein n=1 Tax=Physcomitrium patens TaxID=3218 RepID=A0A2K1IVL5_PHYPA|nr:hypothetical protein PHYPA_025268 [Physcomitrium patens]
MPAISDITLVWRAETRLSFVVIGVFMNGPGLHYWDGWCTSPHCSRSGCRSWSSVNGMEYLYFLQRTRSMMRASDGNSETKCATRFGHHPTLT